MSPDMAGYATFATVALAVSMVPFYLFHTVYDLDVVAYAAVYGVLAVVSAGMLTTAYANVSFNVQRKLYDDGRRGKAARAEGKWFALAYNNAMYLFFVVVLGFFVLSPIHPLYNLVASVGLSSTALTLLTTRKQNKK